MNLLGYEASQNISNYFSNIVGMAKKQNDFLREFLFLTFKRSQGKYNVHISNSLI